MKLVTALVAGLMLLGAACGSGSDAGGTAASAAPVGEAAPGISAPAVSLRLDDGSVFDSAQAVRPTLYVFWAEW